MTHSRSSVDDLAIVSRSTTVDHALETLRRCVADLNYTSESLEVATGRNKAHISRVLNGIKPMTLEFLTALPTDLQGLYEQRRAEHFGLIVVRPLAGLEAQRAFVAGALGLLTSTGLPTKADAMVKAGLHEQPRAAVNE